MTVANALNFLFLPPEGYEFTGEYRFPNVDETFLSVNGNEPVLCTWSMILKKRENRLILRSRRG